MSYIVLCFAASDQASALEIATYLRERGFNIWHPAAPLSAEVRAQAGLILILLTPAARKDAAITALMAEPSEKTMMSLLLKGHQWKQMAHLAQDDLRGKSTPSDDFLLTLENHLSRQATRPGLFVSEAHLQKETTDTIMHRPESFGQLRDALRSVLKDTNLNSPRRS